MNSSNRFYPDSHIEIINTSVEYGWIQHAIFDFDITISLNLKPLCDLVRTVQEGGGSFYIWGDHRETVPNLYHLIKKRLTEE